MRRNIRGVVTVFATVALVGLGAACSTGSSGAATCDSPTKTTEVVMQNISFAPSCVSATANDTLSLVNKDSTPHTFTVKGTSVNVTIDSGQTASASLTGIAPGTYAVTCQFHPAMTETLQIT